MTFENERFDSYKDARVHILGSGDFFKYYNPKTGRPIKKLREYLEVVLYGENEQMGYKSLTWLKRIAVGNIVVRKELFDQNGEFRTFNDLWEAFQMIDFQR